MKIIFVLANLIDWLSTWFALKYATELEEGNPVGAWFYDKWDVPGLFLMKLIYVPMIIGFVELIRLKWNWLGLTYYIVASLILLYMSFNNFYLGIKYAI